MSSISRPAGSSPFWASASCAGRSFSVFSAVAGNMRSIFALLLVSLLVSRAFGLGHSQIYSGISGQATATYAFAITGVRVDGPNFLVDWSFSYADSATGNQGNLSYPYSTSSGFYPYVSIAGGPESRIATLNSEATITGTMTIATTNGYIDLYIKSAQADIQGWSNAGPERVNLGNCSDVFVDITPAGTRSGVVGQTLSWTATRSQGNGQYNFSVLQGYGTLAGNPATGIFTFTPSAPGPVQIGVWTSEAYPFCRSADEIAFANVDPAAVNRVTLTFDNSAGKLPRLFKIYQDGNLITTRLIPEGERLIQTITVPNNTPVSVVSVLEDITKDGTVWHPNIGEVTEREVAVVNPVTGPPSDTPPPPAPDVTPIGPNDPKPQPDNAKSVWESVTNNNVTNNVTNNTYVEGIDKLGEKIDKTNSLLTEEHEKNDKTREDGESVRDAISENPAASAGGKVADAQAAGTQAAADLEASGAITAIKSITAAGGVSSAMSTGSAPVIVNVSGPISSAVVGGASLNLSPGTSGGLLGVDFSPFLTWVRHFIAAMALLWFAREVIEAVKQACMSLAATPQHALGGTTTIVSRVNVLGNTVGAVPAAAMWGVVIIASTAAIIAAPTILASSVYLVANVSGLFSGIGSAMSSFATAAGGGGTGAGVMVKIFELCNLVCPVGLLITIAINRVLVSITSLVQFVALQVAVKLIGFI